MLENAELVGNRAGCVGEWEIEGTICQWECGEPISEGTFGGRHKHEIFG